MNRTIIFTLGSILMIWSLFSCSKKYPTAECSTEEGFVDFTFAITRIETLPSGERRFHVRGKIKDQKVGFIIELEPKWNPKLIEGSDDVSFYWGKGAFVRSGEETDNFVSILSGLYGVTPGTTTALKQVVADVVGLSNNPENIDFEQIPMKFFFNSEADEAFYSEVFINIDLSSKKLEFHEKDPEYREPLIKSLTQLPNQGMDPTR